MKTREQQRAEILKGMFNLRGDHFRHAYIKWSYKNDGDASHKEMYEEGMNYFYDIGILQEIILKAMEVKPEIDEVHTEMAKLSRRSRPRKITWRYIKYSAEQKASTDQVIRNMAKQGYIELRHDPDSEYRKNIWKFKILRTR